MDSLTARRLQRDCEPEEGSVAARLGRLDLAAVTSENVTPLDNDPQTTRPAESRIRFGGESAPVLGPDTEAETALKRYTES